jgi:3-hydroxyisobutyrate dehydrogenase-like beta-hydroxyacid dehydrogenase
MERRIGFAGLGLMGRRMAANLLEKGFPLTVWNRTIAVCEPLWSAGAGVAHSARELGEASDVVVSCVSDPAAVEEVVFGETGLLPAVRPGFRYVETSTISPALSRRLAEALRAREADVLEAPMTGSRNGAERGSLLFMTGGRPDVHEELLPILMAMGSRAIYCGEIGQASVMKLIGNSMISFLLEGLCEGLVLGRKAGLQVETIIEMFMASGFASPYFAFKGGAMARGDWDTHFSIDLLVKDQTLALAEGAAHGVPMPGLAAIREVCQAARAQGYGSEDIAAVVKAVEAAAGLGASTSRE